MSWLRNSSIGASLGKLRGTTSPSKDFDLSACYDSFRKHWQQISDIIQKKHATDNYEVKQDDVLAVVSNLDHMVTLLILELKSNQSNNPCLEHVLSENLLDRLYNWCLTSGKYVNTLRIEQLKLYEVLISHSHTQLLVHEAFHRPLLRLLTSCSDAPFFEELEKRLVVLLNQLCVSLVHHQELLQLFFDSQDFVIFSLLIPFVHRDGSTGQQARDALLFCSSLSKTNESVASYIANRSDVCLVLATGLSGLYSLLPHKINTLFSNNWYQLASEDVHEISELSIFMNSLEFCNAVVQGAHPMVSSRLLEFLYQGFLVPVMGPALLQNSEDELITSTVYFDLFIRSVSEPGLIHVFLKFLFKEQYDDQKLIDCLLQRICGPNHQLAIVTLSLLETLIDLNCEDVMLELVFKFLIPCNHVMASQKCRLSSTDTYCKSAEKFLLLSPKIEWSENVSGSHYGNYFSYLSDAKVKIEACSNATASWVYCYNGESSMLNENPILASDGDCNHSLLWSDDLSSGYESFARDIEIASGPESSSPSSSDVGTSDSKHVDNLIPVPTVGPFIEALFNKLEMFLSHDILTNLRLTSVISRLAIFPQPLLRSLLLDHSLIFQPSIKSLFHIIGIIKQKLDDLLKEIPEEELKEMVCEGERLLLESEKLLGHQVPTNSSQVDNFSRSDVKRRSFSASINAVFRRNQPNTQLVPVSSGFRYLIKNNDYKRIIICSILLREWLLELAAISLEHAVSF